MARRYFGISKKRRSSYPQPPGDKKKQSGIKIIKKQGLKNKNEKDGSRRKKSRFRPK